jgi:hypothetical protein
MTRVRRRRRHHKYKKVGPKVVLPNRLSKPDTYAATRRLERWLFNGVPGKIDGWGFP